MSKEEDVHGNFGITLINIIKEENPEWFDEDFKHIVTSACVKAYKAECSVLDWIFEEGELSFLSKEAVKEFIKNRFNNSLSAIGYDKIFNVNFELLESSIWFEIELKTTKEGDFFYKKSIDYNKKSKTITEDDLF